MSSKKEEKPTCDFTHHWDELEVMKGGIEVK